MEKYAEYRDGENKHIIYYYPNGKFYNHYSVSVINGEECGSSIAGGYSSIAEAQKMMHKHRPQAQRIGTENLELYDLWIAACSGDNDELEKYYENGGEINRRYSKFGKSHSLIAGAYRNGNLDTVELLQKYGETPEEHERDELKELYYRAVMSAAEKLVNYMRYHNKNLTKKQEYLIDDLAAVMQI